MSNERETYADPNPSDEPVRSTCAETFGAWVRELKASPVGRHLRGAQREALLVARSVLDLLIERLEDPPPQEEPTQTRMRVE